MSEGAMVRRIFDYVTGKVGEYDFATQMIAQTKGVLLTIVWTGVGTAIIRATVRHDDDRA